MTHVSLGACSANGVRRHWAAMRASRNFALLAVGMLLAGVDVTACTLDLQGVRGESATTTGAGGATATSSASSPANGGGGSGGNASSATGTGGRGGSMPLCGDGKIEGDEQCDDSNVALGDGCSPTCTLEPLDTCPGLPISLAPPSLTILGTLEGAKDDLKPSCGKSGADVIYEVTPRTSGTLKLTLTGDFDKSLSVRSSCHDGPTTELSCRNGQGALVEYRWVYANVRYSILVDGTGDAFSLRLDLTSCGDGTRQELEECDDPNDTTCLGCFRCKGTDEVLDPASNHCYKRIPGQGQDRDWQSARKNCLAWGGDLVGISSTAEADFLKTKFNDMWSGANDITDECSFNWVNGEPWQPHWANNRAQRLEQERGLRHLLQQRRDERHELRRPTRRHLRARPGGSCGDGVVQPGEECDDTIAYDHITCKQCAVHCPSGEIEDPATRHCYRVVTGAGVSWDAARNDCASSGAYLAVINSPMENALLQAGLTGSKWIGASRANDNEAFKWLNTDALCYTNWSTAPMKDGKHCAALQPSSTWSNNDCNQSQGYICERDN